ncbi:MAG TPA: family 1 glycosylhydrolase [Pyrinomonadaceae bacterium]|nr:family 1 glycosylhydrolase [Pyrinomonadaceae bacterium]
MQAEPTLAVWAGVEATVNRVGNSYSDQIERSGHALRITDLDRLASLGVKTVRYPVLWERTAPRSLEEFDWRWSDERLNYLRRLDIKPIAGLLHHGSGPPYTDLLDPEFPEKLAQFAAAAAKRYPWVEDYTPVNEPLTTARFSCLYGHWYPHKRDALLFAKALLAQCRATVLAMREIRKVNPSARLIQTEDLGKTYSTPPLAYQAEFENERRWLTFDLLTGQLNSRRRMWQYFRHVGIKTDELKWFLDNPMPPDILGLNHYITSQRFLDHRIGRYSVSCHGGNWQQTYADVEAVRACPAGMLDPKALIKEVWDRYEVPLAITEAHLACTREEQLRWFKEIWEAAQSLRREGVEIRAVTAWSAFGSFDWNSLLTKDDGCYESGVFDLRSTVPRPTALAKMMTTLAGGRDYDHPVLDSSGWWRRFDRLHSRAVADDSHDITASVRHTSPNGDLGRALLITGATGTLGKAFARMCEQRGLSYYLLTRQDLDIAEPESVKNAVERFEPWAIINAAGYVRVDDAEHDVDRCMRENVAGPANLASICAGREIPLVTFSSDLIFDGNKDEAYVERDQTSPLNVYGLSKVRAEAEVLKRYPEALIIRTSAFFGPWDEFNFVHAVLRSLSTGNHFIAANDVTISPTYVPHLVHAALDLLIDGEHGVWHLANSGAATWADFAALVAEMGGSNRAYVRGRPSASLSLAAPRPRFSALSSERATLMPSLERGLENYFHERKQTGLTEFTRRILST